ncbi:hypothetical protein B0H13DRAFT_1523848, partial [Mycena leptocephala]
DIIWGCLTTVFACTWVSVHPNLPLPNQNWLALLLRKLRLMLVAVFAPELMVGFAARQFGFGVSLTHGFFISMGGFVTWSARHPITTMEQLEDPLLGPVYLADIRDIDTDNIMDRSKGDALSKGVALSQVLWFITQFMARMHQRLRITELEVATLGFAITSIFIWLFWWHKPLDVQQPIPVGPVEEPEDAQPPA